MTPRSTRSRQRTAPSYGSSPRGTRSTPHRPYRRTARSCTWGRVTTRSTRSGQRAAPTSLFEAVVAQREPNSNDYYRIFTMIFVCAYIVRFFVACSLEFPLFQRHGFFRFQPESHLDNHDLEDGMCRGAYRWSYFGFVEPVIFFRCSACRLLNGSCFRLLRSEFCFGKLYKG